MNIRKTLQWIGAFLAICTGSVLNYLLDYKNDDVTSLTSYLLIFFGWMAVLIIADSYINIYSNTISKGEPGWFAQRLRKMFAIVITLALIFGNVFGVQQLGNERRANILNNGPTQTTVAVVSSIERHRGRSGDYYYAVFQYQANGHTIWHKRDEDNGDFTPGQRFKIQYSVEYPDMFRLIEKLP